MGSIFTLIFIILIIFWILNASKSFIKNKNGEEIIVNDKKIKKGAAKLIILALLIGLAFKSITIVDPGTVKIQILFGRVKDRILKEGLNLKNPLAETKTINIQTQEYTMSMISNEGRLRGNDSIATLTKDGLSVQLDLTGWFHVMAESTPELYRKVGLNYENKIIRPSFRTSIRDVVSKYPASSIYSEKREQVSKEILARAKNLLDERGIFVENVLLRNVGLPQQLKTAIEAKLAADQEQQKMEYVLKKEKKEKERKIIEAEGIKKSQEIINKTLTSNYLKYYKIQVMQRLVTSPNNTVIFVPDDMDISPIIDTKK